jgi:hypothetical protein
MLLATSRYFEKNSYVWRELLPLKVVCVFYRQSILYATQCHNPGQENSFMSAAEHAEGQHESVGPILCFIQSFSFQVTCPIAFVNICTCSRLIMK